MREPYMVQVFGEPEVGHPDYWDSSEIGMSAILYAESHDDAERRARMLAELAQFVPSKIKVVNQTRETGGKATLPA